MGLTQIKAFAEYTVRTFIRDKSDVFWVVVWPILMLFLIAYVFMPSTSGKPMTIRVGVINYDNSSSPFNGTWLVKIMNTTKFNNTKLFDVIVYKDKRRMIRDLEKAKIGVGIIIPKGFGENLTIGSSRLVIYVSGSSKLLIQIHKQAIESFLSQLSKRISNYKIKYVGTYFGSQEAIRFLKGLVEPINATIKEKIPLTLELKPKILGWFVWSAIGMMFLYTGLILGATAVVSEKERGTLERILAAPVSEFDMLFGKMLGGLCILFLSTLAVIFVGIAMGAELLWNPFILADWIALISLVFVAVITISMGYLLSLVSRSTRAASNLGVALGLMLTFTTGIWLPKEQLPSYFRVLANMSPPTWGIDIVRDVLVLNRTSMIWYKFAELSIATIIALILGLIAYRKTLRRYVEL